MNRLGFNEEEVGNMSLKKFFRLYESYKMTFDVELIRSANKITYSESERQAALTMDDAIPF
ncbi:MAG: hypothetical protein J6O72_09550 [Lachnospira sp.]|nr:hypothetical protein [Lachnospira sp.]